MEVVYFTPRRNIIHPGVTVRTFFGRNAADVTRLQETAHGLANKP
jgi:hypothetical protein